MCVEYSVKISYKLDKKWKSYSLYNLSTLTLLPAVIFERAATHLREGRARRGWGNGVANALFFLTKLSNDILSTFLWAGKQVCQHTLVQYHSSFDGGRFSSMYPSTINSAGFTQQYLKTWLYGTKSR